MIYLSGIDATASALQAEKYRADIVAQNIANAHTTRDIDGRPYQRKIVSFESILQKGGVGVRVADVKADSTPGVFIHDPDHPHANADGMVEMPNVNLATEMVDLMAASRAYEANLAVVRAAKSLAAKALTIGK